MKPGKAVPLAIAFCCSVFSAIAQAPSRLLTPTELTVAKGKLMPSAIPAYAGDLEIEQKQSFALPVGAMTMWILPVTYQGKSQEGTRQRCGIFTLASDGKTSFVETFGPDLWPWECDGVRSLGFMQSGAARPPRILVQYEAAALISVGDTQIAKSIFVFDWDGAAGRYAVNKAMEDKLGKEKRSIKTIPEAKRVIQSYDTGTKAP